MCPGGLIEVGMAYQGPSQENPVAMLTSGRWNSRQASTPCWLESRYFVGWKDVGSLIGGENKSFLQINVVRTTVNKAQPQGGRSLKEN